MSFVVGGQSGLRTSPVSRICLVSLRAFRTFWRESSPEILALHSTRGATRTGGDLGALVGGGRTYAHLHLVAELGKRPGQAVPCLDLLRRAVHRNDEPVVRAFAAEAPPFAENARAVPLGR